MKDELEHTGQIKLSVFESTSSINLLQTLSFCSFPLDEKEVERGTSMSSLSLFLLEVCGLSFDLSMFCAWPSPEVDAHLLKNLLIVACLFPDGLSSFDTPTPKHSC